MDIQQIRRLIEPLMEMAQPCSALLVQQRDEPAPKRGHRTGATHHDLDALEKDAIAVQLCRRCCNIWNAATRLAVVERTRKICSGLKGRHEVDLPDAAPGPPFAIPFPT